MLIWALLPDCSGRFGLRVFGLAAAEASFNTLFLSDYFLIFKKGVIFVI